MKQEIISEVLDDEERQKFEAAMASKCKFLYHDAQYFYADTQLAWLAWQRRADIDVEEKLLDIAEKYEKLDGFATQLWVMAQSPEPMEDVIDRMKELLVDALLWKTK